MPDSRTRRAFVAGESSRVVRPIGGPSPGPSDSARRVGVPGRSGVPAGTLLSADMASKLVPKFRGKCAGQEQPRATKVNAGACVPDTAPKRASPEPAPKPEREREREIEREKGSRKGQERGGALVPLSSCTANGVTRLLHAGVACGLSHRQHSNVSMHTCTVCAREAG